MLDPTCTRDVERIVAADALDAADVALAAAVKRLHDARSATNVVDEQAAHLQVIEALEVVKICEQALRESYATIETRKQWIWADRLFQRVKAVSENEIHEAIVALNELVHTQPTPLLNEMLKHLYAARQALYRHQAKNV